MKPTFEQVAALLCKDEPTPDWVIEKLRENAELVGYLIKPTDDRSIERLLFESALHLQELLQLYPRAAKLAGEDYDPSIDDIDTPLHNLIEFLAKEVALPKRSGGPIPDDRRYVCARVCAEIWEKLHDAHQPRSERLWKACELTGKLAIILRLPLITVGVIGNVISLNCRRAHNWRKLSEVVSGAATACMIQMGSSNERSNPCWVMLNYSTAARSAVFSAVLARLIPQHSIAVFAKAGIPNP